MCLSVRSDHSCYLRGSSCILLLLDMYIRFIEYIILILVLNNGKNGGHWIRNTERSVAAVRLAASRLGQAVALGQLGSKWRAEPA